MYALTKDWNPFEDQIKSLPKPVANIESIAQRAHERLNVPHHCEHCGDRWSFEDQAGGARYFVRHNEHHALWLCVACLLARKCSCGDDGWLKLDGRWRCFPCGYNSAN